MPAFADDVVDAIRRHMNDDHAEDRLLRSGVRAAVVALAQRSRARAERSR